MKNPNGIPENGSEAFSTGYPRRAPRTLKGSAAYKKWYSQYDAENKRSWEDHLRSAKDYGDQS